MPDRVHVSPEYTDDEKLYEVLFVLAVQKEKLQVLSRNFSFDSCHQVCIS